MKKIIALSLVFAALGANAKMGDSENIKYVGDLSYQDLCEAVVKDDVAMFERSITSRIGVVAGSSKRVLKRLTAANGMRCNGVDLVSFSKEREATNVYSFLANEK
ncbi:hypothetical protein [Paraglaciecola sp. 2405UD69-4]|uniref:hypothetical protein n=1 Tax=Paraglaciecola sp. 2405UD69-4 TaxID=3391836 RepID=UPI0039C9C7AC